MLDLQVNITRVDISKDTTSQKTMVETMLKAKMVIGIIIEVYVLMV
jgi:hypothetical protein